MRYGVAIRLNNRRRRYFVAYIMFLIMLSIKLFATTYIDVAVPPRDLYRGLDKNAIK